MSKNPTQSAELAKALNETAAIQRVNTLLIIQLIAHFSHIAERPKDFADFIVNNVLDDLLSQKGSGSRTEQHQTEAAISYSKHLKDIVGRMLADAPQKRN